MQEHSGLAHLDELGNLDKPVDGDEGLELQDQDLEFEDEILLLDEHDQGADAAKPPKKWKVIVVDDEEQVHDVTRLALKNFEFDHKSLDIISAYSAEEAQQLLDRNPDTAVLLLDVVMETDHAGLELVKYIRENLDNGFVRIVLRTGQPGAAPEVSVIEGYDINDYKTKTELTQQKLFSTLITAIRSYRDIIAIEDSRQEIADLNQKLQNFNRNLEALVQARTQELETKNQQLEQEIQARLKAQEELQATNRALDQANKRLAALANHDGLTELANRRRFNAYLQQLWQQGLRDQTPLTLILCDIDYFKQYNDTYGHLEGDLCLRTVAQAIRQVVERPFDLAARYGGEEFAVVLPDTVVKGGQVVAEKIQAAINQLRIPHRTSSVSDYVTVSIGISELTPMSDLTPQQLVATTDAALYQAKASGRARIVINPSD